MMRPGLRHVVPAFAQVTAVPSEQEHDSTVVAVMLVMFGASWVAANWIFAVSEAVLWLCEA
jgi:hypothetical protein